jgi:mannose-1-phosphate guanylyltransferase
MTVERFLPLASAENFWVVTSERYVDIVRRQLPLIPSEQILAEPEPRNTAPCIAYASWKIAQKHPEANIVVTPADALVLRTDVFTNVIQKALDYTESSDSIVTVGITPTRPETGYGYIHSPKAVQGSVVKVSEFREKPNLETAQEYIKKNYYFWNAGIFIWNVSTIVNAFRIYQPTMSKIFESMLPIYGTDKEQEEINRRFPECENISVDYAIMEKAEEIFVCPADFGWSDLGTWGSLHEQSKKDLYGNVSIGEDINLIESHNCIVHTTQEKKVVIQGLDGYIVAEKDNTLLICKLSEEQRIKQFSGND